MIRINYWTSQYFEENVWDKYYCKTFSSAKRRLKEIVKNDKLLTFLPTMQSEIIKEYDKWVFDKKTCFSSWCANISIWEVNIFIEEIILD